MQSFTVFTFVSIVIVSQRNHCYIPTSIGPVEEMYTLLKSTTISLGAARFRMNTTICRNESNTAVLGENTSKKNQLASMTRNKIASIL